MSDTNLPEIHQCVSHSQKTKPFPNIITYYFINSTIATYWYCILLWMKKKETTRALMPEYSCSVSHVQVMSYVSHLVWPYLWSLLLTYLSLPTTYNFALI
uniref:Uncharacterized protein n=1 Tax=Cacopsylla melanoneura TaxID=428564 RepID=A0A8D8Y1D2_9HEMI